MSCLLHMSDPHFGTEQPHVVRALLDLVQQLQPQAVLIGGDVTQRARKGQFRRAASFFRQLGCPIVCVPGNHDIPLYNIFARLFSPYENYKRECGSDLEPTYDSDEFLVIGVNSTRPGRHKDGEVSPRQIARVRKQLLAARAGQIRLVMAHHPVRAQVETDRSNLLHGREQAVPEWVDAGADFILGGHIHLPYCMPVHSLTDPGRRAWVLQAGTALSSRVRGDVPNSVNVIDRPGGHACFAERWDFDAASGRFGRVQRVDASRPGPGAGLAEVLEPKLVVTDVYS